MAFWGVEVKPGKPFTHSARGRLHISQATLGLGTATNNNKTKVQCNVGNKSPVLLCSLSPDKSDSCQLNLEFEEPCQVVFSVIGPQSVHLTGYFLGSSLCHNLNDDSESYGEDIADTDTERSHRQSDEDEYEDSFIDDSDPGLFPSSDDGAEEKLKRKKAKMGNDSRRRLRKKYKVIESDNDSGTQAQQQNLGNGSAAVAALDNETEDMLPISAIFKGDHTTKSGKLEAKEKAVNENDDTNLATKSAKFEVEEKDDEKNGETCNVEVKDDVVVNGTAAVAVMDSETEDLLPIVSLCKHIVSVCTSDPTINGRILEVEEKVVNEDDEIILATKNANSKVEEIGDEKTDETSNVEVKDDTVINVESERRENLQNLSVPSSNVEAENWVNDLAKVENSLEADGVHLSMIIRNDKTPQDELHNQDMPVGIEQNRKQVNDNKSADLSPDSLPLSSQEVPDSDVKPEKRKKRKQVEEKGFEANISDEGKPQQNEVKSDDGTGNLPMNIKQFEMQPNANQLEAKEKKKKRKKRKIQEEGQDMNTETPMLSTDENSSNADSKPSQLRTLSDGLVIQELETGKPDGKVATSGKKISIRYIGKLKKNGREFDSNLDSTPFKFRLGKRNIIDGLNIGLEGMQVGGKRRLIIPPSLGYGSVGDDGQSVPPNSWLVYDVELVKVW